MIPFLAGRLPRESDCCLGQHRILFIFHPGPPFFFSTMPKEYFISRKNFLRLYPQYTSIRMWGFGWLRLTTKWQAMTLSYSEFSSTIICLTTSETMNIIDFVKFIPDEESYEIHSKSHREKAEISCISCSTISQTYWFIGSKLIECS